MAEFEEDQQSNIRKLETLAGSEGEVFDLRCNTCSKLLARNNPKNLSFDIKCHRCITTSSFFYDTDQMIYFTDIFGKISYVNEQAERITGYLPEELLGKTPAMWGKQMPNNFYKELWVTILSSKKPVVIRIVNRRKNGQLYEARTKITPILNSKGKVGFFLGIQALVKVL